MTGSEHSLDIYLGRTTIAALTLRNDELFWQYHQDWQQSGFAISPHLSLAGDIPTVNVRRFLRNLFPEGEGLDVLLTNYHLSKSNTFGLLRALGMDTPGSLWFLPVGQALPTTSSFRLLTNTEIENRLDTRSEFSLFIWDGKPRLSVAGIQDKINVVKNFEGQLGFGEGRLASTHILKFEKQKLSHLAINEYMTMQLAGRCGLQVANLELLRFGKYPALLIERFDRKLMPSGEVLRRHVIDGCQALNLPPEYKYERNFGSGRDVAHIREGASLTKLFNFVDQCENPADTKNKMLDWVLFNLLTYNFDAHGKNISFFVSSNGLSLAPFYDLVNIGMYPDFDHELAMGLGDDFDGVDVTAYQLADFADSCQLGRLYLVKQLTKMVNKLSVALDESVSFAGNNEESKYLKKYQAQVRRSCEHLLEQADKISSIEL